jgi:hypothetical protein
VRAPIKVVMFSLSIPTPSQSAHSRTISIWCIPWRNTLKALPAYDVGNAALVAADAFASVFSVAFFAAFALAMAEQRSRSPTDLSTVLLQAPVPHDQNDN